MKTDIISRSISDRNKGEYGYYANQDDYYAASDDYQKLDFEDLEGVAGGVDIIKLGQVVTAFNDFEPGSEDSNDPNKDGLFKAR